MPDPNLPPLFLTSVRSSKWTDTTGTYSLAARQELISSVHEDMPALPDEIRERLVLHGLTQHEIDVLMAVDSGHEVSFDGRQGYGAVTYFEALLTNGRNSKTVINW